MQDLPGRLICGVDRLIVERFLVMIRDNYRKADKAAYLLEQRAGISKVCAVMNLRDAVSRLASLLDPKTNRDKWQDHPANAEEHLRRAIIEPREIAINGLVVRFQELYWEYRQRLLPVQDAYAILCAAPTSVRIDAVEREVEALTSKAKDAKVLNSWDDEWEQGVAGLPEAYEKLHSLYSEAESYWHSFQQLELNRRQLWLGLWALLAAAVSVVLTLFPNLARALRNLLRLR
jgi:hypothetical protein